MMYAILTVAFIALLTVIVQKGSPYINVRMTVPLALSLSLSITLVVWLGVFAFN